MSGSNLSLRHLLAGLEAGVTGAFAMLGWFVLGSMVNGRSLWLVPNLFATVFHGSSAYQNHFNRDSWAGVALIVLIYGLLGGVWGMVWRESDRPGLMAFGGIVGIAVYLLFFRLIWPQVSPAMALYAPDRQLQIAHILWGIVLGRSPLLARRIAERVADQQADSIPSEPPEVIL
jgi:hypothetical protein